MSVIALIAAAALQSADAELPGTEYRLDRGRSDGQNTWSLGPWSGTFGGMARRGSLIPGRSNNYSRASFTVHGPHFEDGEVGVRCEGRESSFSIGWIEFDRDELVYACDFYRNEELIDTRFELAFSRGRGFIDRMSRNRRAGEIHHEGRTVRFETLPVGSGFLTGQPVAGYNYYDGTGNHIGRMEYNMMRPDIVVPPDGSHDQEAVLLAALALVFFMDPANDAN